ncbi:MAG: DeoR/GlpR family DNA-binding transcription regulator [Brevinema sp.]
MKEKDRKKLILSKLKDHGHISVKELSVICGASLNTVRSDIEKMREMGLVLKFHGGVALAQDDTHHLSSSNVREQYRKKEKQIIGSLVASKLPRNREISLFFDSSTTSLEVAKSLVDHPTPLTIVTNYADVAEILSQNAKNYVYFCGGRWVSHEHISIGEETVSAISKYSVDYAILGCTGLSIEHGIFNGSHETLVINQAMKKTLKKLGLSLQMKNLIRKDLFGCVDLMKLAPL